MPIYLDHSTTTFPLQEGIEHYCPFLKEKWGYPHIWHSRGKQCRNQAEHCFTALRSALSLPEQTALFFASSAAQAIHFLCLESFIQKTRYEGKNEYVTLAIEQTPILTSFAYLEELGARLRFVPVTHEGKIDLDSLAETLSSQTALVSLSSIHGLTGIRQPIEEVATLCREKGIWLHLDITHSVGRSTFDWDDIAPTFITLHGDQCHAPSGTGLLCCPREIADILLVSESYGMGMTLGEPLNGAGLFALAKTVESLQQQQQEITARTAVLQHLFEESLVQRIEGCRVLFQEAERESHCSVLSFPYLYNEALFFRLNQRQVYASIGGEPFQQLSWLLKDCHVDAMEACGALHFSFSHQMAEEEITRATHIITEEVHALHSISKGVLEKHS